MSKFLDTVSIFLISFALCYLIVVTAIKNTALSLAFSLLIAFVFTSSIVMKRRTSTSAPCKIDDFFFYVMLQTNDYITRELAKLLPENNIEKQIDNTLLFQKNDEKYLIYSNYKLSQTSADDILKIYKLANKNSCKTVFVLQKNIDRKALSFARNFDITFEFISHKSVYAIFKKHNILPTFKKKHLNHGLTHSLRYVFTKKNAKYYLLSGIFLGFSSFLFGPLKLYYRIFSCINLLFALICRLNLGENYDNKTLFKTFF